MRRLLFQCADWRACRLAATLALCSGGAFHANAASLSAWVVPDAHGRMLACPDELGNRVLDYSGVGYKGGTVPIPQVPVKISISPVAGDDGPNIQAAINIVKGLPPDPNGFRGAVLLAAGEYDIAGSISINASGVVLRGSGDGTNGTILRATGTSQRTLVTFSGAGSPSTVSGTTHSISDLYVPVGARSFNVSSTSGLAKGDRVLVRRSANAQWITDMGMDLLCCEPDVHVWTPGEYALDSDRIITRIEGNRVMLDAPLTCAIDTTYGGGSIRKYTWSGRITNVGIENIRAVSDFAGAEDESHAWTFVKFTSVENGWARSVTSQHFGYACVSIGGGCRNVTIKDSRSLEPVSIITGSRRYAFVIDDGQLCLVQNCYTQKDRHQFVTQSQTIGPNVFVDGLSDTAYSDAGPHHRWGTGAIWDNVTVNGNNINVQNRGNSGSGHGWAGGNEVVWNCRASAFVVQNPPTARNWLIGSIGTIRPGTMYVGPHAPGTYDAHGSNVFPNSLYYAQLQDRLASPGVETREYTVGEINRFAASSPSGTPVPVDPAWRLSLQAIAGAAKIHGFDIVTNQWVPFTFYYTLAANERIVGASLSMGLRAYNAASINRAVYLDSTAEARSFAALGWEPIATGTNTSAVLLDLASELPLLADGRLNVAIKEDAGIDWARLELRVAPVESTYTNRLVPVNDAQVRGGIYSGINYGTATTLEVAGNSAADNQRRALLQWDLTGYPAGLHHARVRLVPVSAGTPGEAGLAIAGNDWNQQVVTWDTRPEAENRFATWITGDTPEEFVVTPQAQAALAGEGKLSLELFPLGTTGTAACASAEYPDAGMRPQLLLVYTNPLPVISSISNQEIPISGSTGPLPFTVGDPAYPVDQLSLGIISSDSTLLPASNIAFGGALSNRTVTVTPAPNRSGIAHVSIVATNPAGMTAGSSFAVVVGSQAPPQGPVSGTWIADASGNWNDSANWAGGIIATGASMNATFAVDLTAERVVSNDLPRYLGGLIFRAPEAGSQGAWSIINKPFTLDADGGIPRISASNTVVTIQSVIDGNAGLSVSGNRVVSLAGPNLYRGATTIASGALRAEHNQALGAIAEGTSIGNDPTACLELAHGVVIAEPLTVACKQSAAGPVPAVVNVDGINTLAGDLSLTTGGSFWTFEARGGRLQIAGATTNITTANARTLWLRGAGEGEWSSSIGNSAAGLNTSIRKDGPGLWILSGPNTYTGTTVVSNGTLRVTGSLAAGGPVTVAGGTLEGNGTIHAPLWVQSEARLSPGIGIGTLTVSNKLTLSPGAVTVVEIDSHTSVCDRVTGITELVYGGTLSIAHFGEPFVGGESFQLFVAEAGSSSFLSIEPAVPGPNLMWRFDPLTGVLSVEAAPQPSFVQFGFGPDGGFTVEGTGPVDQTFRMLASTNLALPLEEWLQVSTGVFTNGRFDFVDPFTTNFLSRFYRLITP